MDDLRRNIIKTCVKQNNTTDGKPKLPIVYSIF